MAYLDDNGLLYFWQAIKTIIGGKVDKVSGKGLSTEDYTSAEKTKLSGIAAGAEVNVQPDWNETGTSSDAYIKNKPTIPTKVSDLTNDGDGTTGSAFATEDYVDTNGGKIDKIKVNNVEQPISNKTVDLYIPVVTNFLSKTGDTMTGALTLSGAPTSDLHAATKKYVDDTVQTAVTGVASFQGEVNSQSTIEASSYKAGWYWVVGTAGTYVGQTCEVGDQIYAKADKGSSYSASDFNVIQVNLNIVAITNAQIDDILAS